MSDPADEALMARAGQGDRTAFAVLMRRHLGRVVAVAARVLGNVADAEEVAQEVFAKVWSEAPRWQPLNARFTTWLYRVAVNRALDRRRRFRPSEPVPEDLVSVLPDGFDAAVASDLRGRLVHALGDLPERQRTVVLLRLQEELTQAEVAGIMELSEGAVESLLVRARKTLRQALGDQFAALGG